MSDVDELNGVMTPIEQLVFLLKNRKLFGESLIDEAMDEYAEMRKAPDRIIRYLINEGLMNTDDLPDNLVFDAVVEAVAALRAELELSQGVITSLEKSYNVIFEQLAAKDAALEDAKRLLKPFALEGEDWSGSMNTADNDEVPQIGMITDDHPDWCRFTVGDLRRATKWLKAGDE